MWYRATQLYRQTEDFKKRYPDGNWSCNNGHPKLDRWLAETGLDGINTKADKNPSRGKMMAILYLEEGDFDGNFADGIFGIRDDWNNGRGIRCLRIRPGPSYRGERLRLFDVKGFKGPEVTLGVGDHWLKDPKVNFAGQASAFKVVGPSN